jgi:hypothetical protein
MRSSAFHATASAFIKSLIRQRRYLIAAGHSYVEPGFINKCLEEVDKYMRAYTYDTDEKMSNFWVHHSDEIFALIPGRNSGSHKTTMKVYHQLNTQARDLYFNPVPWWEPLMRVSPN